MNNAKRFVEACRFICRMRGEVDEREHRRQACACHFKYDQETLFYCTDTILIGVGTKDLSLFVERRENGNPVVCIAADGSHVRYHGEACYLFDEVNDIVDDIIHE